MGEHESGWQGDVKRAVFETMTMFARGLDGKHGSRDLQDQYQENHFIMFSSQRTFDTGMGDGSGMRALMWSGENQGGAMYNLMYAGLPASIALISSFVPGMMAAFDYHDVTYDPLVIWVLPKWDAATQSFIPDTWQETGAEPTDLENRYALSFCLCNGRAMATKDNPKRNVKKGDVVYPTFYEVHGNKFYRKPDGRLGAKHVLLSEYDDTQQTVDEKGKDLPQPDMNMLRAFVDFMRKKNIVPLEKLEEFEAGKEQFRSQYKILTGHDLTTENSSFRGL